MGIEVSKIKVVRNLDYEKVIQTQDRMIKILKKEILYLRQYLNYVAEDDHASSKTSLQE